MKRSKMKTIKKSLGGDKDIVSMFNQMLGTETADPKIILPKYKSIKKAIKSFSKIVRSAANDVLSKTYPDQKAGCVDLLKFCDDADNIKFVGDYSKPEDEKSTAAVESGAKVTESDLFAEEAVSPEEKKHNLTICDHYKALKKHHIPKLMILTCKNLMPYKKFFSDGDDSFISRIPGMEFNPYPFSALNVKHMWKLPITVPRIKKYIYFVLKLSLDKCVNVYRVLTSPDVDVKEFSKIIIASISQVKKQIPRCGKAFKKIEESVGMLEGNFGTYYKDFIQSQNPNTIISSFMIDISDGNSVDSQTARQFKKIIAFYQKKAQGKIKDPKLKKIFEVLNSNIHSVTDGLDALVKKGKPRGVGSGKEGKEGEESETVGKEGKEGKDDSETVVKDNDEGRDGEGKENEGKEGKDGGDSDNDDEVKSK